MLLNYRLVICKYFWWSKKQKNDKNIHIRLHGTQTTTQQKKNQKKILFQCCQFSDAAPFENTFIKTFVFVHVINRHNIKRYDNYLLINILH